jgi:hypothetical protein
MNEKVTWEDLKNKGNIEYRNKNYHSAINYYSEAICIFKKIYD